MTRRLTGFVRAGARTFSLNFGLSHWCNKSVEKIFDSVIVIVLRCAKSICSQLVAHVHQ